MLWKGAKKKKSTEEKRSRVHEHTHICIVQNKKLTILQAKVSVRLGWPSPANHNSPRSKEVGGRGSKARISWAWAHEKLCPLNSWMWFRYSPQVSRPHWDWCRAVQDSGICADFFFSFFFFFLKWRHVFIYVSLRGRATATYEKSSCPEPSVRRWGLVKELGVDTVSLAVF